MQKKKRSAMLSKTFFFVVAMGIGFGIEHKIAESKIEKERSVAQGKMSALNKKMVLLQKQMTMEKYEKFEAAAAPVEVQCKASQHVSQQVSQKAPDKESAEKKNLIAKLEKLSKDLQDMDVKTKYYDEQLGSSKVELAEMKANSKNLYSELNMVLAEKKTFETQMKKTEADRDDKLKNLKIAKVEFTQCSQHNAELALLAEDLVEKYRNKGFGSLFLEKEPITGIKKIDLDKIVQQYSSKIKEKKIAN
jgi:chromosome segregation ATPase